MTTVLPFTSTPIDDTQRCPSCGAARLAGGRRWWCRRCGEGGSAVDYEMLATACPPDTARARLTLAGTDRTSAASAPTSARLAPLEIDVGGRAVVVDAATSASIADLADAVGVGGDDLSVDGALRLGSEPLTAGPLARGAVVGSPSEPSDAPGESPVVALRWQRGLEAGRVDLLPNGRAVLGTGPAATVRLTDPSVARYHTIIEVSATGAVTVESLGPPAEPSGPARRPGDTIALGRSRAVVSAVPPAPSLPRPSSGWRIPFHRPPRPLPPPVPLAVVVPEIGRATGRPAALGWAGAVTGIATGVGISLLLHSPLMLAMSAVGATGSLASAHALRRRHRRDVRATDRATAQALSRFTADLAVAHRAHLLHRRAATVELDDTVGRALVADSRLWERRPGHADVFDVLLGHGDEPWEPPLDGPVPTPGSPLGPALATHLFLADVPVTTTLGPGAVLGLAGPPSVTEAVARSLVIQLAVHQGPADLIVGVAVTADRLDRWRWVEWLPHGGTVGCGEAIGEHLGERLTESGGPGHAVLITDDPGVFASRTTAARRLVADGAAAVVIAARVDDLPAVCTEVLEVAADGACRSRHVEGRPSVGTLQLIGAGTPVAADVAGRSLASTIPSTTVPGACPTRFRSSS